jgi:hypothetical protein
MNTPNWAKEVEQALAKVKKGLQKKKKDPGIMNTHQFFCLILMC